MLPLGSSPDPMGSWPWDCGTHPHPRSTTLSSRHRWLRRTTSERTRVGVEIHDQSSTYEPHVCVHLPVEGRAARRPRGIVGRGRARRARPRRVARGLELARYRLAVQEPGVRAAPLTGSPARVSVGVGSRRWRVGSTDSYGWYRSTANDACGPPEPATPEHTTDPSDWIATLHAESKPDVRFVVTVPSPPKVGSGVPSAR